MAVKMKAQKDYYLTEVSVALPATVSEVDLLMKATKANGKMIVLYNGGAVQGINVEQRRKISDAESSDVRESLGIETKAIEVKKSTNSAL